MDIDKVIKKNDKKIVGIFFVIISIFLFVSGVCILNFNNTNNSVYADEYPYTNSWVSKEWLGYASISGSDIWTVDGTTYYFSNTTNQYYLYDGNIWTTKVWTGLTNFNGKAIWTDGTNIYYSLSTTQKILDISTSTWSNKTWTGLTSFNGLYIWTDGTNMYYGGGSSSSQWILDSSTSTWSQVSWSGSFTAVNGAQVWTNGTNIYMSAGTSSHYILDISTSTWFNMSWTGFTNFTGANVWTDGYYYYTGEGTSSSQYVFDFSNNSLSVKTWTGYNTFYGTNIWTDGTNIYYSYGTGVQYVLSKIGSIGGDTVVYNFTGANINVPTTLTAYQYGGINYYNNYNINFVDVKLTFSVDSEDNYNIAFDVSYIRTYANSNSVYGYSQSVITFDKFSTSVNGTETSSNILVFDNTVFGNSLYFYAIDSNVYTDNSVITSPSNYRNYASFLVTISSGFTDYNFVGVRLYNDYVQSGNTYNVINHIRYFDADNEYIDIALPLRTTNLADIEMYSSRYYYFSRNIDNSSETYQSGYDTGYSAGQQIGQSEGYTSGYNTGYDTGYSAGQSVGSSSGYTTGYNTGYSTGYSVGYSDGTDNSNAYTFTALIGSIIDTPISYFRSLLNFNLLGVNLLSFFLALITLATILYVVKLLMGAK